MVSCRFSLKPIQWWDHDWDISPISWAPQPRFGVGVPKNLPAFSPDEAVAKANEMPGDEVVVPQLQDDLSRLAEEQQIFDDFCIMCIYIY